MEKLPIEHIKVKDGPQPVVARPAASGALIYCEDGVVEMSSVDDDSYGETEYTLTLASRSTVAVFCTFNATSEASGRVTITSGIQVNVENQAGPYAITSIDPDGDLYYLTHSINLVITRDPGEHILTLFTRYDNDDAGYEVDYSLTVIVSTDNDQECIPTEGGG